MPTALVVSALAGAGATYVVAGDPLLNAGVRDGIIVPAGMAAAGATTGLLALASRGAWRWPGSMVVHAAARAATMPLFVAAAAGTATLGVTLLADRIGGARRDHDGSNADATSAEADRLREQNDARDATVQGSRDAAVRDRAAARREVDELYEAHGGFAPRTSIGTGRVDVAGRSPEAAVDLILDAYGDDDGRIGVRDVRIVGPSTFALTNLIQHAGGNTGAATRDQLVAWFKLNVDTRAPKGTIDVSESVDWQSGRFGEQRTTPGGS